MKYSAIRAQARAGEGLLRPKTAKFFGNLEMALHVTTRLEAFDSPMTISLELRSGVHGVQALVSHECIHQAIYAHGQRGFRRGLHTGLHRKRRCRKHRFGNDLVSGKPVAIHCFNTINTTIVLSRVSDGHSNIEYIDSKTYDGSD